MKLFLNGIGTKKELLSVNDGLNYGRFLDDKTKVYEIQLQFSEIRKFIEKEYNEIREEMQIDDKVNNDTSEFSNTNYCSFNQLLEHESDFESIIKTYLDRILFTKLFCESTEAKYVINSTESITLINNEIIIRGRVFNKK